MSETKQQKDFELPISGCGDRCATCRWWEPVFIQKNAEVKGTLIAPIKKGTTVGELTLKSGNQVVARIPLIALADVPEAGFFGRLYDTVKLWFN